MNPQEIISRNQYLTGHQILLKMISKTKILLYETINFKNQFPFIY